MKRAGNLLLRVAEPENLRFAAWKAAKGKRHSREVLAWMQRLNENVLRLREQVLRGQVEVGRYRYFKVFEPKERQICASAFGEQVLHHALMNICHEYFERAQIFDSYASRQGKGTYAAIDRAGQFTRQYDWYLKLDVRKFFESVHHEVLVSQLSNMFKDAAVVGIFEQIIHSYAASPGRGLPIGNLTSQYFANHYLVGLDRFVKEKLHIRAYTRYMDDFVLWSPDKGALREAHAAVQEYVETALRCTLKPEGLNRTRCGLPFLGYHIFPHYVRLLQKSKQRFIRKMRRVEEAYQSGAWSDAKCRRRALPLLAFVEHADAKKLQEIVFLRLQGQSP
jgi:retron-type reverse transcriptase